MKRYSILSLLFMFFVFGGVAQVDSLILPFNATTLTEEQKNSNPDYLAYPLMLASQMPEINCNQITDCEGAVDLGLSVLWATHNVGAEKPEDYGDYFAWGETQPKGQYDWTTYKYCKGTSKTLTKYCIYSDFGYNGFVDNKVVLDPEDDAATVNWGGNWRMPTEDEFIELLEKCKWIGLSQNGVNGHKVVGPNGKSIFLPAAGYKRDDELRAIGNFGCYWLSSLATTVYDIYGNGRSEYSWSINFYGKSVLEIGKENFYKYDGYQVRPVCSKEQVYVENYKFVKKYTICENELPYHWRGCVYNASGVYYDSLKTMFGGDSVYVLNLTVLLKNECKEQLDCIEVVDLGLSVKWATCNVGAKKPEEYGDYFAWGEVEPKEQYDWTTYKYFNVTDETMIKYTDRNAILDSLDDVAIVNWGGNWRMPTATEQEELCTKCTWVWTTQNGVNGYKVVGKNGNSIFLPAAGCMLKSSLMVDGLYGYYHSSSIANGFPKFVYILHFGLNSVFQSRYYDYRYLGFTVRPVCP